MKNATEITIKGIFTFHGLYLPILGKGKEEFIPLKPITDLIGVDWRNTKNTFKSEYKTNFYQFCQLTPPAIAGLGGDITPQMPCILLKKVHFYLAQINPERIKSHGNIEAAEFLIKLHHEWADALYQYETHGVAVNKDKLKMLRELMTLRNQAIGEEVPQITAMINSELQGASFDDNSPQMTLALH